MELSDLLSGISTQDMEKLKQTAMSLMGEQQAPKTPKEENEAFDVGHLLQGMNPDILQTAARLSNAFKQHDDKSDFMLALMPLLSEQRRQKAKLAADMLRFLRVLNEFREGRIVL